MTVDIAALIDRDRARPAALHIASGFMADEAQSASTSSEVSRWLSEIERAQNTRGMKQWRDRCKKIRDKYRYESSVSVKQRKYQMLWSNEETMKPSVYTKSPKGVVQQRWKDRDPVAAKATEMLERCINFTFEANDYSSKFEQVRDDYLLYARGQARIKYKPIFDTVSDEASEPDDAAIDPKMDAEEEGKEAYAGPETILKFENVLLEYTHPEDFVHAIARTWDEVPWVAFKGYLTRDELVKRFGDDIGKAIPLDAGPDQQSDFSRDGVELPEDKATIWEVWNKRKNEVLWIAKGHSEVLESGPPYLKLDNFFPCPRPAYGTMTNDTLEPVPDYIFYKDQAEEIDTLTARIGALSESLKLVGFYPAGPAGEGSPEVERAITPGFENKMIAVKSWAVFTSGAGGGAPIVWLPIDQVAKILEGCVKLRQQLIEDVYQIYGLSDIMRGDGNANETATAQSIKAQYGSIRIRERQNEMARFCRDISRLVGEVLATYCSPKTLMEMANMKLPTQAELDQQAMAQQQAALIAQAQQQQAMQQQMGGMANQMPPQAPQNGMGPPQQPMPQPGMAMQ